MFYTHLRTFKTEIYEKFLKILAANVVFYHENCYKLNCAVLPSKLTVFEIYFVQGQYAKHELTKSFELCTFACIDYVFSLHLMPLISWIV